MCVCMLGGRHLDTVAHFAQGHPVAYVYFRSYILRNNIFKNLTFGADVNKLICPYFVKIVLRPKRKVFAKLLSHIKKTYALAFYLVCVYVCVCVLGEGSSQGS